MMEKILYEASMFRDNRDRIVVLASDLVFFADNARARILP